MSRQIIRLGIRRHSDSRQQPLESFIQISDSTCETQAREAGNEVRAIDRGQTMYQL